ncbi:TetR/AcrR family transcriptional regulator [Gordonia rhizosphera]|uniref:Putative TetR family transcriptional regulator n=1 Tax=Gordonia rhizosphera NBRC 16068 TaxID=1108045 RepID=K6W961_9ACTN|nr:TetR/AcrR family transcriptional regulator [Gordonia rhizosphera]GAB88742.1 putative TetR family transcriptional regulator [Gordonia rhizosphera NBRC 16068]
MTKAGKAQRTRERLIRVALDLFSVEGFDNTSVAQIASAAGVTEMTFYRNFPTKDSVVLDDPFDPVIADAIIHQHHDLPALAAIAAGIREVWSSVPTTETGAIRDRLRVIASSDRLRSAMTRSAAASELAICGALRIRGTDPDDAEIAAAAAIAALNAALMAWSRRDDAPLSEAIEQALDVLEGSR